MGRGLSQLQTAILMVLDAAPHSDRGPDRYGAQYIGHMPTTGEIMDALGRPKNNTNYAAVSKALRRLEARGLITSYRAQARLRGNALRYSKR